MGSPERLTSERGVFAASARLSPAPWLDAPLS
jgi:hypothetical protein